MNPTEAIRPTHVEVRLGTLAQNFDAIRMHVERELAGLGLRPTITLEIDGVPDDIARESLRLGAGKLPIKTRIVTRLEGQ